MTDPASLQLPALPVAVPGVRPGEARSDAALRAAAAEFEAAFLAEMLGHAGLGAARESFGGGVGEQGFASLLTREHARLLAERGGIGLAERIFEALKAEAGGDA